MKCWRFFALFSLLVLVIGAGLIQTAPRPPATYAQTGDPAACSPLIQQALTQIANTCIGIGRNEACYASPKVDATLRDLSMFFASKGDIVPVEAIESVVTQPADPETGEWGIVLMDLQADLPGDSDGVVRLLLYGGVNVQGQSSNMQSFTVQMDDHANCQAAPSGLMIQSPAGKTANLKVNNVDLRIGSTAFLTLRHNNRQLTVSNLRGNVSTYSNGVWRRVPGGTQSHVIFDENGEATIPSIPDPITDETLDIDFSLLEDVFEDVDDYEYGDFYESRLACFDETTGEFDEACIDEVYAAYGGNPFDYCFDETVGEYDDACLDEVWAFYADTDSDEDGVNDLEDWCPWESGLPEYNGCAEDFNATDDLDADVDGDGLNDAEDFCPGEFGLPDNNGCPDDSNGSMDDDSDDLSDIEESSD